MPNTFTLIASSTLGSAQSVIDFTSIPNTYTDLCIKLSLRNNNAGNWVSGKLYFNGGSVGTYTSLVLYGDGFGTGAGTYGPSSQAEMGPGGANALTANNFSNIEVYIPNYVESIQKSFCIDGVMENNAQEAAVQLWTGLWNQTAAISQVSFTSNAGSFMQYSSAYLYGIVKS